MASGADPLAGARKALADADRFQKSAGGPLRHSHEYSEAPYNASVTAKPAGGDSDAKTEAGNLGKEVDARRAQEDAVRTKTQ